MSSERTSLVLALVSVTLVAGVGVWGFVVDPEPASRWLLLATVLPLTWAYVELAQVRGHDGTVGSAIITFHRCTFAWAGLMLVTKVGLRLAVAVDLVGAAWLPLERRVSGILLGAGLIAFGNYIPKLLSPWRLEDEPFEWQRVHRFAGWVLVLAGVGVIGSWIAFPTGRAADMSATIVGSALLLACVRKLISLAARGRSGALVR